MATTVVYPGLTGAQSDFAIPFEYLSVAHVHVTVGGLPVPFTFSSKYLIHVTTPPVGTLKIARITPNSNTINDYTDGSILAGNDLDNSFLQNLFLNQENADRISVSEGALSDVREDVHEIREIIAAGSDEAALDVLDLRYLRIVSNPVKNMLQRGMKPTGNPADAAENTARLNETFDEIKNNYGGVYIPLGTYFLDETLAPIVDTSSFVYGDGSGISRLVFTGLNPQGLRFNLGSLAYSVGVRNLSILIYGASSEYGLRFERPDSMNSDGYFGPIIENVEIGGVTIEDGFASGIMLNNCWGARVSHVTERGIPGGGFNDLSGASIVIDGNSTGVIVNEFRPLHREHGIYSLIPSFSEGLQVHASEMVNCNWGVYMQSAVGAPEGASPPWLVIADSHFAVNKGAVASFFRPQLKLRDNLIYNRLAAFGDTVNAANFMAFYLNNANQSRILNNELLGFGYGTFLNAETCIRTTVAGNYLDDCAIGINGNNNSKLRVRGNEYYSTPTFTTGMAGSSVASDNYEFV